MTREVYRKTYTRSDDTKYHLFEDCFRLEQARAWRPFDLDKLRDDTECCALCIKRAFLRKEPCSRCDAEYHALDLATLDDDGHSVLWPCPDGGFTDEVPADIFRETLASAGLDIEGVREAAERLDTGGERGPQLASRLDKMDADEIVTDGGRTARRQRRIDQRHMIVADPAIPTEIRERVHTRLVELEEGE